jgi:hypothetical protein
MATRRAAVPALIVSGYEFLGQGSIEIRGHIASLEGILKADFAFKKTLHASANVAGTFVSQDREVEVERIGKV